MFQGIPVSATFLKKMNRKDLGIIFVLISIGLGLAFMVFYGNEGGNEWYANDAFLVMQGESPYKDFFYHRLPLFLYLFYPLKFICNPGYINFRIFLALVAFLGALLLALLLRRSTSRGITLCGLLLMLLNFHGLHILTTIQVYAAVGLLFLAAVVVTDLFSNEWINGALLALLLAIAQWMRYPIDYIPVAFVTYIVITYRKRFALIMWSLGIYTLIHLILVMVFSSEPFFKGIMQGMFLFSQGLPKEMMALVPHASLLNWVRYKQPWLFDGARWFGPVIILGLSSALYYFIRLKPTLRQITDKYLQDRQFLLASLLVAGNLTMYILAPEGHPVQMYYVFPLMIYLACRFMMASNGLLSQESKPLMFCFAAPLLAISPFLDYPPIRLGHNNQDGVAIRYIAQKIQQYCRPGEYLLTFTPIIALESKTRVFPGLEFETFGFYNDLTAEEAANHRLSSLERLKQQIEAQEACAAHLDDRFMKPSGNSTRLKPVQKELLEVLKKNYYLVENLNMPPFSNLRGDVSLWVPIRKDSKNGSR